MKMRRIQPSLLTTALLAALLVVCPFPPLYGQSSGNGGSEAARTLQQRLERQQPGTQQDQIRRNQMASAARQLEMRGNYDSALKLYRDLVDQEPNRSDYFSGLIRNLVALGQYDEAVALIEQKLERPEGMHDEIGLRAELGAVHFQAGRNQQADIIWENALTRSPSSTMSYQTIASVMIRLRLLDRAEEVLRRGRATLGDPTLFSVNLATLLQARMDWEGAAREYLISLRTSQNRASYIERSLAGFADNPEANEAVEKVLREELKQAEKGDIPWTGYETALLELLAGHHTSSGQYQEALNEIRKLDATSGAPGHRLLDFAAEASSEGFPDVAELALADAAERFDDPEGRAVATLTLARIAEERGQGDRADSLLSEVLKKPASARVEQAARFHRGVLRLELLDDPRAAGEDFRSLLLTPNVALAERLRYLYAVCLAKQDSLDAALAQLGRTGEQPPSRTQPPAMPGDGGWLLEEADAGYLEARIAFWLGRPATAAERIEKMFEPPTGANSENEALDLLHIVLTTQDSIVLERYAAADRAAFLSRDSTALALFDSLADSGKGYLYMEAAWRAAMIRFESGQDSALVQYADQFPEAVHAEEALFITASHWEEMGEMDRARTLFETLLVDFPDGLLTAEARLRYDVLTISKSITTPG